MSAMVDLSLKTHPDLIFAYSQNHTELIVRVENNDPHSCWVEADVLVPERLSLSPDNSLRKGRVRIGIINGKEYLKKAVKVYANTYTNPQIYRCKVVGYVYNKDGIIESRLEKPVDIRCEMKKAPVL